MRSNPKAHLIIFVSHNNLNCCLETGEAKERHDVLTVTQQENIQQAITAQLERFGHHDNLRELRNSMAEIGDDDTLKSAIRRNIRL